MTTLEKSTYLSLPSSFYKKSLAAPFKEPQLLFFNKQLAADLGFHYQNYSDQQLAHIFSGQVLLPGSTPLALAYAGFQFAHPAPLLGDGRAIILGELKGFDLQLKGSGQTPFSRRGDGRSALGPVIREYVVSEFMNRVGIPTTRALAAVSTGEEVFRQFGPEPGGVFTRVASSHLRVGTFQYCMFNQDELGMKIILDYTIERHYPELRDLPLVEKCLGLLAAFASRQGELIASWSGMGFIHGVMNTDNCSVAGLTIDYGPCAFLEEFSFNKYFSSIDERARYSFFNQVPIVQWNILRLADCLLPLIDNHQEQAIKRVEERLHPILATFTTLRLKKFAQKMGIDDYQETDEELVMDFLKYLETHTLDFTLSFRHLTKLYEEDHEFYPWSPELDSFVQRWRSRVTSVKNLDAINPLYIPRNHLVQKAIDLAYSGNYQFSEKFMARLADPFTEKAGEEEFALPAQTQEKVTKTYCGT